MELQSQQERAIQRDGSPARESLGHTPPLAARVGRHGHSPDPGSREKPGGPSVEAGKIRKIRKKAGKPRKTKCQEETDERMLS